jgi:cytochrome c556
MLRVLKHTNRRVSGLTAMKTILVTMLVTAVVGSGVAADNRTPARRARTLATTAEAAAPQKLAASQASTLLSVEAQNQLVRQYCATCHQR